MTNSRNVPDEGHDDQRGPHGTRRVRPGERTTKDFQTPQESLFQITGSPKLVLVTWRRGQHVRVFILQHSHAGRLIVDEPETGTVVPSGDHRTIRTSFGYLNIPAFGRRGNGMLGQVPLTQLDISRYTITYDHHGRPNNFQPTEQAR